MADIRNVNDELSICMTSYLYNSMKESHILVAWCSIIPTHRAIGMTSHSEKNYYYIDKL